MSELNSNTGEGEAERLRGDDGFQDWVVRAAEQRVLTASLDELVVFAFGTWGAAAASWAQFDEQRRAFIDEVRERCPAHAASFERRWFQAGGGLSLIKSSA